MWIFTKKSFNGNPLFFQFLREEEFFTINFTNLKQMFSKKIDNSFASKHLYSVSIFILFIVPILMNYFENKFLLT